MKRRWPFVTCLLLSLTTGVAVLADDDHREARRLMESGAILPLEEVIETIRKQRPGRILEVELEREHGGYVYEIEAVSGRLLEIEEED